MFRVFVRFVATIAVVFGAVVQDAPTAIIGGNLADIADYPFYAFLGTSNGLHCGGSFIARDIVLTAAHCLENDYFKVYTGITTVDDLKDAVAYDVAIIKPHPEYHGNSGYDIGLVKLKENITLGDKAQLIEPAKENPPSGEEGTVVGFGVNHCDNFFCWSPSSKHLRSADLEFLRVDADGVIYTQSSEEMNTCYGDSGGPIIYEGKVVGLVSSGQYIDCTGYDTQAPVARFYDWIKETSESLQNTDLPLPDSSRANSSFSDY